MSLHDEIELTNKAASDAAPEGEEGFTAGDTTESVPQGKMSEGDLDKVAGGAGNDEYKTDIAAPGTEIISGWQP